MHSRDTDKRLQKFNYPGTRQLHYPKSFACLQQNGLKTNENEKINTLTCHHHHDAKRFQGSNLEREQY